MESSSACFTVRKSTRALHHVKYDPGYKNLEAARWLLEEAGPHGTGMEEIAQAAGVSRQSAYLHFGSKTGLLLALVAHVDAKREVNQLVDNLWTLPDALTALEAASDLAAATNPEVHRIALALDAARRWDPAFEEAWQDRTMHRLDRYRRLARWLKQDGSLAAGWSIEHAMSFLWSLTSVETYDQLVVERGCRLRTTHGYYELRFERRLRPSRGTVWYPADICVMQAFMQAAAPSLRPRPLRPLGSRRAAQ